MGSTLQEFITQLDTATDAFLVAMEHAHNCTANGMMPLFDTFSAVPQTTVWDLIVILIRLGVLLTLYGVFIYWLVNLVRAIFPPRTLVQIAAFIVWEYYRGMSMVHRWICLVTDEIAVTQTVPLLAHMLYHQVIDWVYTKARNRLCPVRKRKRA